MAPEIQRWWFFLCGVSVINLLAWGLSAGLLKRQRAQLGVDGWAPVRWQLMLSAVYVLGCAYRSALPVLDIQRLCLVDSWMSSVAVGRSVATLAELCFAAQWALLLRGAALAVGSKAAAMVSRWVLPLIATAEACSWSAVLTTSNLGHVLEESLWGLTAALIVASLLLVARRADRPARRRLICFGAVGLGYVTYMLAVDVPMYWARWLRDEALGRVYFSLGQGWNDAASHWVVAHGWDDWKAEIVWMSLYFSLAVWLSIGLAHLPLISRGVFGRAPATS